MQERPTPRGEAEPKELPNNPLHQTGKDLLARIVAMLTRLMAPDDQVKEEEAVYGYVYEYVYGEEGESGGTMKAVD